MSKDFGKKDFAVSDKGLFRVTSTKRFNPLTEDGYDDGPDVLISEGFDESGEAVVVLDKPAKGGFGLTLGSKDEASTGVYVAAVKPNSVAEEILEEQGLFVIDGLRFKLLNGTDVLMAKKKECVAAMRACGKTATVVFVSDAEGFADWADSDGKKDLAEQARVKARTTWNPRKSPALLTTPPPPINEEDTIDDSAQHDRTLSRTESLRGFGGSQTQTPQKQKQDGEETNDFGGFDQESPEKISEVEEKALAEGMHPTPTVLGNVEPVVETTVEPVTVVTNTGPTSPPPKQALGPPTAEELSMGLTNAQTIMGDGSLDDLHPTKMVARRVLNREAQRIEAMIAAMDNSSSDDDDDNDTGGTFNAPTQAQPIPKAPTPVVIKPKEKKGKKEKASVDMDETIDTSVIDMDLDTAQSVMHRDELPDDHPEKTKARTILLAEAQRIERSIAALDASSSESEEEETWGGFGDSLEPAVEQPKVEVVRARAAPQPVEPVKAAVKYERRTEDIVAENLKQINTKGGRKYATEDERVAAEVNVNESSQRAAELSFDFGFGFDAPKPQPTTSTTTTTVAAPINSNLNQFNFSQAVSDVKSEPDDLANKQATAQAEARRMATSGFNTTAIKEKEVAENAERMKRLNSTGEGVPKAIPKLNPINRKYATEDERIAAEVNVDASTNRAAGLSFDFAFGAPPPTAKAPTTTTTMTTTTTATSSSSNYFSPPTQSFNAPKSTASTTVKSEPTKKESYFKPPASVIAPKESKPTASPPKTGNDSFNFGFNTAQSPPTKAPESTTTTHVPKAKPKLSAIDRKYATEDERVQAEASVEATQERLGSMTFDFAFG